MKKVALTSIFANLTYNNKNHRGLETVFFKKFIERNGDVTMDLVGYKNRNVADLDFFIDFKEQDFSEYSSVLIQLSTPNFFGGQMSEHTEKIITDLANYSGNILFLINDPRIKPVNPAKVLSDRFNLCTDLVEKWDQIIETAHYLFPGRVIKQFLGWEPAKWSKVDWFTYIFKGLFEGKIDTDGPIGTDKKWDLVYYGDKRGSFRENQLRKYFPTDTQNLLIGYKSDKVPAEFIKKLAHPDLMAELKWCRVSLITGDEEHLNNVTTFRLFETMASECLAAIQIEYDPERKLIQDPVLRELLYVTSKEDVKRLAAQWSPELIIRQRMELKRIFEKIK
jgi:hypothetical protein